jgi:uncharacterized sulfatase
VKCALLVLALLLAGSAQAATAAEPPKNDYRLLPVEIAKGVQVFTGKSESFSRDNGGNIVNTAFLVGTNGVVVIDTGPSRAYGEQQRAVIARVTKLPVRQVYNTHAHPDHFLGNQAYPPAAIAALPATIDAIQRSGEALSDNLYRLVGGWMIDTHVVVPKQVVTQGPVTAGGRQLLLIGGAGHTDGDLMVFDVASRTLFTGDLVFHDRAPTTPNADLQRWLAQLDAIDQLDYRVLVPGHGSIVSDRSAVAQTREYLRWLGDSLRAAAARGLDMEEVMRQPIPERFRVLAVVDSEYARSVSHLYPKIELETLPATKK